jgi:ribonuclease-3
MISMLIDHRSDQLKELETKLGVVFEDQVLLNQALTHTSYAFESREPGTDNERLEFFGDAVLKLAISEYLYKRFPKADEGELTKIRAMVVSDQMLSRKAKEIELGRYILLSQGEARRGGADRDSNQANALEALFGAYYWDQKNIKLVMEFIVTLMADLIEEAIAPTMVMDPKSDLQEYAQKRGEALPVYKTTHVSGPEHEKTFMIKASLTIAGRLYEESAEGKTKKEAEQKAAREVLQKLTSGNLNINFPGNPVR